MKLVKKVVFAIVLLAAAAPVIGLADSPWPECNPCTSIASK